MHVCVLHCDQKALYLQSWCCPPWFQNIIIDSKSCRSCLHFGPAFLKWKTLRADCGNVDVEKLKMPFFFSITLIYISQSPFIKTLKKDVTRTSISQQHTDINCNLYMRGFCACRAHFKSCWNGIVLMGWALVCVLTVSEKYLLWEVLRSHDPLHS